MRNRARVIYDIEDVPRYGLEIVRKTQVWMDRGQRVANIKK